MGIQFLRETEASEKSNTTHCCVCNRTYSDGEIGWTYRSFYKVYVCSTECYKIAEGGWRDGKKIMVGEINVN